MSMGGLSGMAGGGGRGQGRAIASPIQGVLMQEVRYPGDTEGGLYIYSGGQGASYAQPGISVGKQTFRNLGPAQYALQEGERLSKQQAQPGQAADGQPAERQTYQLPDQYRAQPDRRGTAGEMFSQAALPAYAIPMPDAGEAAPNLLGDPGSLWRADPQLSGAAGIFYKWPWPFRNPKQTLGSGK